MLVEPSSPKGTTISTDTTALPELQEVDPDLMRRVAWGMIAGKTKAEIAEAEEISREDCEIVCMAPGMFSIMNVWVNFLERRKEGGRKYTRKLTGWCVDHVFQHAPERLNRNEIWRLDRLSSVMLDYGFAIVFGWMLGFLDGVMGVPGSRRKDLGDFKQNLVDLLCWAVEVTFREKMLEQHSVDLLIAKDGAFQAAIAGREYFEFGMGDAPGTAPAATTVNTAAESPAVAPLLAASSRTATKRRSRAARPASSRPTVAPTIRSAARPERAPWPLRRTSEPWRRACRPMSALRWRDGCSSPPPLHRSRPIERAAVERARA